MYCSLLVLRQVNNALHGVCVNLILEPASNSKMFISFTCPPKISIFSKQIVICLSMWNNSFMHPIACTTFLFVIIHGNNGQINLNFSLLESSLITLYTLYFYETCRIYCQLFIYSTWFDVILLIVLMSTLYRS